MKLVPLLAAAVLGGVLAMPAAAHACGFLPGLLSPQCQPAPAAPDPGGAETPDQPVPAPGKGFGFNSGLYLRGRSSLEGELDRVAAAGATLHRLAISWRAFQISPDDPPLPPADPGSSVERVDMFYAAAQARGIDPLFVMSRAPRWATRYRRCGLLDLACRVMAYSDHNLVPDEAGLDAYRRFVAAVKERWPAAIVESWNEPNHHWNHPSYTGTNAYAASPAHFARIQCAAYEGSKAVNDDPVLSAGWADHAFAEYLQGVYEAGGAGCWDRGNVHLYTGSETSFGADTRLARLLHAFRGLRAAYADEDPFWVTETGFTTSGDGSPRVTAEAQADGSRRIYNRLITMPEVEAVLFHTLRDSPSSEYPYSDESHREYGFGFLHEDWTPKPVYCHFTVRAGAPAPGC